MQYTGHVHYQMNRPSAVEKPLCYLKQNHKLYKDIEMNALWQQEFENDNEQLWQALTLIESTAQERTDDNIETNLDQESNSDQEQNSTNSSKHVGHQVNHAILQQTQIRDHDQVSNARRN